MRSYVDVVQRRLRGLLWIQPLAQLVKAAFELGAVVDGIRCRPLSTMLKVIPEHHPLAASVEAGGAWCHGDLIPEDILPSTDGKYMFVDPNPQNGSQVVDWGKMAMALTCGYDLVYRDRVEASCKYVDGTPRLEVSFLGSDLALIDMFRGAANELYAEDVTTLGA